MADSTHMPRVSVGVPTYNRPWMLERCLEDLMGQSFCDLEIIVSDNASPDPEVERICRALASRDSRVRYFRQSTNVGPIENFQFVLDQARGQYFIWAADDDRRSKDFIETLVRLLDDNPDAVFSFCRFESVDVDGNVVLQPVNCLHALKRMTFRFRLWRQLAFFLSREGGGKPHPIYGLIRRDALGGFSFPAFVQKYGWHGSDVLFVARLLRRGRLILSDQVLMGITVDSIKDYGQSHDGSRFYRHVVSVCRLMGYSAKHVQVASPMAAVVMFLLMPFKLVEILSDQVARPLVRRLSRFFSARDEWRRD